MPKILPDVKKNLLSNAKDILYKDGYEYLNIRKLSEKSNIGIGTFYNYFSSKDDLVKAILQNDWTQILQDLNPITYKENICLKEKLIFIFNNINKFFLQHISTLTFFSSNNRKKHNTEEIFKPVYLIIYNILILHKDKKDINPKIPCEKLSNLILSNMIIICKNNCFSFEDFYSCLNI